MLGLAVVWFAVPLIAGSTRPLRRPAAKTVAEWRMWVGELAIASLIGAWAINKMISGGAVGSSAQPSWPLVCGWSCSSCGDHSETMLATPQSAAEWSGQLS
jgi:hypothetical protein